MITLFTTAKPFVGHSRTIQRNALKSWTLLAPDVEVLLFGDEEGAAEAAAELGLRHVPNVRRVPGGPKLLSSFFDAAQEMARNEIICYVNCDIILGRDFLHAVNVVDMMRNDFLMVGRRWNVDQNEQIAYADPNWERALTERACARGERFGPEWIDYFVFRKGLYLGKLPEFVIGRVHWDQWLVWKARSGGAALVDASEAIKAIHQNHDYNYHATGKSGVWRDELAQRNYELAGGRWHLATIEDATYVLGPTGLRPNPLAKTHAVKRAMRTAKQGAWSAALDWTRPLRRSMGLGRRIS